MKWLIGLAAGAAAVYFFRTEKGKAVLESLQKEAAGIGECLTSFAGDIFKKGSSAAAAADKV
jgi:hypothetical protein